MIALIFIMRPQRFREEETVENHTGNRHGLSTRTEEFSSHARLYFPSWPRFSEHFLYSRCCEGYWDITLSEAEPRPPRAYPQVSIQ